MDAKQMQVELIYDDDCPNVNAARSMLATAMQSIGREADWIEYCRQDPGAPGFVRDYASPTILVDGRDIEPTRENAGDACRIYRDGTGRLCGVPPLEAMVQALLEESRQTDGLI